MHYPFVLLAGTLALGAAGCGHAQCRPGGENTDIVASTPGTEFRDGADGTVLHVPTGLVWQRCALGQSWTGAGCAGNASPLTWEGGLQAAEIHLQDGQQDWRVPNRNELNAIVETRCFLPAVNDEIFPDAPPGRSWTSSPVTGQPGRAWSVDFDSGTVETAAVGGTLSVRLVRSAAR